MPSFNPFHREAALRDAVRFVIVANLAYFFVEFSVALAIHSVALFADGIDFLEDASVNSLILLALAWPARARARVGMGMAALLLVPGIAAAWTAWQNFSAHVIPASLPLTLTGLGALAVNFTCAAALLRFRHHGGSLTKAAFLSARNDVLVNVAVIAAGVATALSRSLWPDLIVGLGIAVLNAGSAREILEAALEEHRTPES
ncbi:MAG: cation transporter [Alphaproteobacteria bacterium]|nr:cation transporter [Alphaproteobacteria bacterium]